MQEAERAVLKECTRSQLVEQIFRLDNELSALLEDRDQLLLAIRSAHGYLQRKVTCRARDTLGRALVDAAIRDQTLPERAGD